MNDWTDCTEEQLEKLHMFRHWSAGKRDAKRRKLADALTEKIVLHQELKKEIDHNRTVSTVRFSRKRERCHMSNRRCSKLILVLKNRPVCSRRSLILRRCNIISESNE